MAGALDVTLGGPRTYQGKVVNLATLGDGRSDLNPEDIDRAVRHIWWVMGVVVLFLGSAAIGTLNA
jgi:adenosylcobinamide-phosphate synthase